MTLKEFLKIYSIKKFQRKWLNSKHFKGNISTYFQEWWNPDKFDWENNSCLLCEYFSSKFDIWWDPKRFNWNDAGALCKYIPDKFEIWWNLEYVHYFRFGDLYMYMPDKFDMWWIPAFKEVALDEFRLLKKWSKWYNLKKADYIEVPEGLIKFFPTKFIKWWSKEDMYLDNIRFYFLNLF